MNSEYWFSEISQSMKNGFFYDSVVLELARIARDKSVSDEQSEIFSKVAGVLQLAKEGSQWLDNPQMSEKSSTCANFFGQAVGAMSLHLTPAAFVRELDRLRQIAERVANRQIPSDDEFLALRRFFFNTGRSELQKTERLMNGGELRWLAAR